MGFTRGVWNSRGVWQCHWAFFSAMAQVPGRKGRGDRCGCAFRIDASRDADWCRHLDRSLLANALCLASVAGKRSEEHTSELQSQSNLVCRLLLEKKNNI